MTSTKTLDTSSDSVALKADELDDLRLSLEAKRQELLSLYEHDLRVGQESTDENADDFADRANNSYNRELMFTLSDGEREMLIDIEGAFARLASGDYGRCVHCDAAIGLERLKAVPWTDHCIACQEQEEQGTLEG